MFSRRLVRDLLFSACLALLPVTQVLGASTSPAANAGNASAGAEAAPSTVEVRAYGAVGDGIADDTAALQAAIAAANKLPVGRAVHMAPGIYRLTSSLKLNSVLLIGLTSGGWPGDTRPLPTLRIDIPAPQPAIIAEVGSTIHGIAFDFDYGSDPHREFGPAVQLAGGGVSIVNVLIHQPTYGIVADGSVNCGRVNLQNIFIVNPRRIGVRFEYGLDIITMNNVEVWNYLPELLETTTGFLIGHADEIRLTNCAVVGAAIGFRFIETKLPNGQIGRVWGGMDNCTVDYTGVGVQVDSAKILRITGGSFWTHHFGMIIDGQGDVLVSNVDIRSNSNQCLLVRGGDNLSVTGSSFKKNPGWESEPKVILTGGGMVSLTGNLFDDNSAGIVLQPGVKRALINDNSFAPASYLSIIDHAPDAHKMIRNNLTNEQ